jgi:hypothetical protein
MCDLHPLTQGHFSAAQAGLFGVVIVRKSAPPNRRTTESKVAQVSPDFLDWLGNMDLQVTCPSRIGTVLDNSLTANPQCVLDFDHDSF